MASAGTGGGYGLLPLYKFENRCNLVTSGTFFRAVFFSFRKRHFSTGKTIKFLNE